MQLQHIEFPQDVNTPDVDDVNDVVKHALCAGGYAYSDKQLAWILNTAKALAADDPQKVAFLLAFARRGGADLTSFKADEVELASEAKAIFDECTAAAFRMLGGLQ
jgi:hypothetical protein